MDKKLTSLPDIDPNASLPPQAPLDMPTQVLERKREGAAPGLFARLVLRNA